MCDHVDFTENQDGSVTCLDCGLSAEMPVCPSCHTEMWASETNEGFFCPMCGAKL